MLPKVRIVLLAFYVLTYFRLGDALLCRDCTRTADGCVGTEGSDNICTSEPELEKCSIATAYDNGKPIWINVDCLPKEMCDTKMGVTKEIHVEFSCCDDSDFCNDKL